MEKCQLTVYQRGFFLGAKNYLISSRSNQKGLHYAMERNIQNLKIYPEGDKLKFNWYSGLPHSLIHITHFFLSCCGLGKGMKHTPCFSLSGYRLSVLYVSQAHCLIMFIFLYTNNINPPLNCYIMPPPCCSSSLLFSTELSELMSEYS